MTLLTLFSAPKPFTNPQIDTIQRNAIQSWQCLGNEVQILLMGDEEGLAQVATEYHIQLLPNITRNSHGTPTISSIFSAARQASESPLLSYVNADIILFPEYIDVAKYVSQQLENFLVIGQRWDLSVEKKLDYSPGWNKKLKNELNTNGRLHLPAGSDFFIFPRVTFTEIPDFAIGRAGWDNWMIYFAKQSGWVVVDVTPALKIIHQDHDYGHLPNGKPHYDLEESRRNMVLAGGVNKMYTILDSDMQLINGKVQPAKPTMLRLSRQVENWLMSGDRKREGIRWRIARTIRRWRRKKTGSLV